MSNKVFYVIVSGFTAGIFISSFFKLGFSLFLFLIILSILLFVFAKLFVESKTPLILLVIFIFSFGLGILRYEIKDLKNTNSNLPNLVGQKITLEGIISAEPSVKDQSVQLIVVSKDEKVLVTTGLFPEYKYGDLIQVEGKLEKTKNFATDTGNDFDYVSFLAKEDVFYQMSFVNPKIISKGNGSFIRTKLFAFKNAFIGKINLLIKEPESSLLAGLLLGAKNSLGEDLQQDFKAGRGFSYCGLIWL
jgi:hypothetical protein